MNARQDRCRMFEGSIKGGMQERQRKGGMQERRNSGKEGFRKGEIQEKKMQVKRVAGRK